MADSTSEVEIGELTLGGQVEKEKLDGQELSAFSLAGTELAGAPTVPVYLVHQGLDKTPFQMWYVYRGVRYGPQRFNEGPKCTGTFENCAQNQQWSYMGQIPCNVQIQIITVDCQMDNGGTGVANLKFSFVASCGYLSFF